MIAVTPAQLHLLAPNIRSVYDQAFASADTVLAKFGINATPVRLRHFMAQILHESGGLMLLQENLNYSAPRLPVVWPKRFRPKGPLDPAAYAHDPQKLGDAVYGNRMGNGPNEGYLYRGRGMIQTTGKEGYQTAVKLLHAAYPGQALPDLVTNPDALLTADWSLKVAAAEYADYGCNAMADTDSGTPATSAAALRRITRRINGGENGLTERGEWLKRCAKLW